MGSLSKGVLVLLTPLVQDILHHIFSLPSPAHPYILLDNILSTWHRGLYFYCRSLDLGAQFQFCACSVDSPQFLGSCGTPWIFSGALLALPLWMLDFVGLSCVTVTRAWGWRIY